MKVYKDFYKNLQIQLLVWKEIFPEFKEIGEKFSIRNEKIPSASIALIGGQLKFKDFGNNEKASTPIDYLVEKYNLSFEEALEVFNNKQIKDNISIFNNSTALLRVKEHIPTKIRKKSRELFSWDIDKKFWYDKYQITKEDLEYFDIEALSHFWLINGKTTRINVRMNNPTYLYQIQDERKLYSPYDKKFKWMGTSTVNNVQGLKQLQLSDTLYITKSLKDIIILWKLGLSAIAPNSETCFIPEKLLYKLKEKFNKIIIYFDNDEAGLTNAKKYSELYDLEYFYNPLDYPKDASDIVEKYGYLKLEKLLKGR